MMGRDFELSSPSCKNETRCETDSVQLSESLGLTGTYLSIVVLLSLTCNVTICLIFYKKPQLLTVSNSFVLNLACCQLGLSILVLPFVFMSLLSRKWILSNAWCQTQGYTFTVILVSLQYSLLVISVDRNYAIVNSLRYPYVFSPKLGNSLIALTWILGITIGMPPLVGWGKYDYNTSQFICTVHWVSNTSYTIMFLIMAFVIPFSVQSWCYASIFRVAIGHTKRSHKVYPSVPSTLTQVTHDCPTSSTDSTEDITPTPQTVHYKNTECKAVKTILIIIGAYISCWTCYVTNGVLKVLKLHVPSSAELAGVSLVFLSCAVNPVIYAFMNRLTRHEIWKYFTKVSQKLAGRTPTAFDSDDYVSSTLTTNFSSGRLGGGLWVTPTQRLRSNSRVGNLRHTEMMTIHEESEVDNTIQDGRACSNRSNGHSAPGEEIVIRPTELKVHQLTPVNSYNHAAYPVTVAWEKKPKYKRNKSLHDIFQCGQCRGKLMRSQSVIYSQTFNSSETVDTDSTKGPATYTIARCPPQKSLKTVSSVSNYNNQSLRYKGSATSKTKPDICGINTTRRWRSHSFTHQTLRPESVTEMDTSPIKRNTEQLPHSKLRQTNSY